MEKRETYSVRLSPSLWREFKIYAVKRGWKLSYTMEELLKKLLAGEIVL